MTSHMNNWTASFEHAARTRECPITRLERAREALAGARAETQELFDQLIATGASKADIARTPAFRARIARMRSCRVELAAASLIHT
jgi:hypothetical protein